jgi:hypothetical protein
MVIGTSIGVFMIADYLSFDLFQENVVHAYLAWSSIAFALITIGLGLKA